MKELRSERRLVQAHVVCADARVQGVEECERALRMWGAPEGSEGSDHFEPRELLVFLLRRELGGEEGGAVPVDHARGVLPASRWPRGSS